MHPPQMFDESSSWMSKFMNRKRFHFFKIIIPNIIQQKRLGLPRKFIRKFRKELSEVVVLTVPNGKKWHVELKEIEGEMWLVEGWQEFVDYYSIADGHFLVFGYDWRSCFHVLIFDMSAAEIEYPCHIKDFEEPNQENECQAPSNENESVESLHVSPPGPTRAESVKGVSKESDQHQTSTMRHLKLKVNCEAPTEGSDSVEIVDVSPPGPIRAESVKGVSNESDRHQTSTMRHLKLKVKCEAPSEEGSDSVEIVDVSSPSRVRAESVKRVSNESDRHQTSTMRHLKRKVKCEAPSEEGSDSVEIVDVSPKRQKRTDFMKEVIDESEAQQTSKVRRHTPSSRLRYSLRSFERKVTRPTSESHWRCRTQVKSSPKRDRNSTKNAEAFSPCQVTQSTESDGCDSPLTEESSDHIPTIFLRRRPATTLMSRVDRDFKSDNPFFLVPMQSSYVNEPFTLNVPSNFAKEYFQQNLCLSLRVSDGRSWQVRCRSVNSNAKISWGWRKFVKENHLKEGDVCVFELVNRRKFEMKVVIYQATS